MTIVIDMGSILHFIGMTALCIGGGMLVMHGLVQVFEVVGELIDLAKRCVFAIGDGIVRAVGFARKLLTRDRAAR